MLMRAFVIASAVFMGGLAFNMAMAEDTAFIPSTQAATAEPASDHAIDGVNLSEPEGGLGAIARTLGMEMGFREAATARLSETTRSATVASTDGADRRRYELALSASEVGGSPVDIGVAPRATVRISQDGDIESAGGGLEARVGRRLRGLVGEWTSPTWDNPTWYFFIADDDEAIAWTPGARADGRRSFAYQEDRVEIGDTSIGIAIEAAGAQAAIAYVERDIQGKYGSAEENFTGVTLTWRR